MKIVIVSILTFTLLITGCVTNKGHRKNFGETCEYSERGDCALEGFTRQQVGKSQYHLGFIEFDDQGFIQERHKKDIVMDQIRDLVAESKQSEKPVLLMTFIHGWHHHAEGDPEDRDIYRFREELLVKAASFYSDHEVIGVYLGWRGRVVRGPLDFFTFWNRKRTAHEVGQNGMNTVLLEIEDAVKGYPARYENNKMITIGHSFGGAALYSAVKNVLADRFVQSRPFGSENEADGFGDLVVLMNPAFESLQYQALFELSQYRCKPYPDTQLPRFMILASKQDAAVGTVFQIGRAPYTVTENHEDKKAKRCRRAGDTSDEYDVNQWRSDMIAVGHHTAYNSHQLQRRTSPAEARRYASSRENWLDYQREGASIIPVTDDVELLSLDKTLPNNPYLSIYVVDDLIPGHNDIWGAAIIEFVSEMIRITEPSAKE